MKTSKQDIQDLLSQLAADIEEIKAMLNGSAVSASVVIGTDATGKAYANDGIISNGVASSASATNYATTGNSVENTTPDRIIAKINRLLEPIVHTCDKLPGRLKSYHVQLWKHIVSDIREELNSDNDTCKRKGLPMVEDKIDNALTMLVAVYDRLNQIEDAMPDTPQQGQSTHRQDGHGASALRQRFYQPSTCRQNVHGKPAMSRIKSAFKSAWTGV